MRFLLSNTDGFAAGFSIINTKFKTLMHGMWGDNAIIRVTSWARQAVLSDPLLLGTRMQWMLVGG